MICPLSILLTLVQPVLPQADPMASGGSARPVVESSAPARLPADAVERYRADVEFLAAPESGGRLAGSPGSQRVIEFLESRFRMLGLEPVPRLAAHSGSDDAGGSDSVDRPDAVGGAPATGRPFLHRFTAPDRAPRRFDAEATYVAVDGARIGVRGEAVPFRGSPSGRLRAPVVFAGYGTRLAAADHDDYRDLPVRDRIVVVLRGLPARFDAAGNGRRNPVAWRAALFSRKMELAAEHGARGLLLCDFGARGDPDAERREIERATQAVGRSAIPAMWISTRVARRLFESSGRDADVPDDRLETLVAAAERGLLADSDPLGAVVDLRVAMGPERGPLAAANVVGRLVGESKSECIVVGAHHDHIGRGVFGSLGGPDAEGRLHPGADDNASGVAGLLAIAEALGRAGRPRRTIVFAAFDAEEQGRIGSRVLVRWLQEHGPKPVAMINLNMIGRGASGVRIEGAGSGRGLADLVAGIARAHPLEVRVRASASGRSDHSSFLGRKVPALLFHTGLHAQYHRPTDLPVLVQTEAATAIAELAAHVAWELACRARVPDYVAPKRRSRKCP